MAKHGLVDRCPERLYADYGMFMEAAEMLAVHGYAKNHFTHFARREDRNLYSRHAVRGEDLVALGATADGSVGAYYYRHGGLDEYLAAGDTGSPLEGGGFFTHAEFRARGLVSQLMAGRILERTLDAEGAGLARTFERAGLLRRDDLTHSWNLTDVGSWFIEPCAGEALRVYEAASAEGGRVHEEGGA
jgi:coproporphyrinogen III oxidase-like Fe-S oxidoreductase